MFARLATAAVLALPLLASATAIEKRQSGSCNVGTLQCCNSTQSSDSDAVSSLLGLLGVVAQPNTMVGLNCNPISVIGGIANGGACEAAPVCCENNAVGGLINIGCVPINIL